MRQISSEIAARSRRDFNRLRINERVEASEMLHPLAEDVTARSSRFARASLDFCGNARRHGEANRRKFYARLHEYASRRLYTPERTRARYH